MIRPLMLTLLLLAATACTAVGRPDAAALRATDFGPPRDLTVCVLREPTIAPETAAALVREMAAEVAIYGIHVHQGATGTWKRPGFTYAAMIDALMAQPMPEGCDRLMGLIDRTWADALWGLALPEALGAVETTTHTRGYVVATRGPSLNQWLAPPEAIARHEFYHLLGCEHAMTLRGCYAQIAAWKRAGGR